MSKHLPILSKLGRTLRTVGSAIVGVRGKTRHEEDAVSLSPLTLILVALVLLALLVLGLVTLARFAAGG